MRAGLFMRVWFPGAMSVCLFDSDSADAGGVIAVAYRDASPPIFNGYPFRISQHAAERFAERCELSTKAGTTAIKKRMVKSLLRSERVPHKKARCVKATARSEYAFDGQRKLFYIFERNHDSSGPYYVVVTCFPAKKSRTGIVR